MGHTVVGGLLLGHTVRGGPLGGSGPHHGWQHSLVRVGGGLGAQGGEAGCGVDAEANGYHLNLVAVNPTGGGNLKAWAASQAEPNGGIVNYQALGSNLNNSNAFMVPNDSDWGEREGQRGHGGCPGHPVWGAD